MFIVVVAFPLENLLNTTTTTAATTSKRSKKKKRAKLFFIFAVAKELGKNYICFFFKTPSKQICQSNLLKAFFSVLLFFFYVQWERKETILQQI